MFATFSLIFDVPQLHQLFSSLPKAQEALLPTVQTLIEEKFQLSCISLAPKDVKLDSFSQFPAYSYDATEKGIDIYEHRQEDKVEKGWIWNAKSKKIHSKKIGYCQILTVQPEEVPTPKEDEQDGLKLIYEEYKPQPSTVEEDQERIRILVDSIIQEINDYVPSETASEDPAQDAAQEAARDTEHTTGTVGAVATMPETVRVETKRNLIGFESLFLPFGEEIKETIEHPLAWSDPLQEEIDIVEVPRYSTSHRGCRRVGSGRSGRSRFSYKSRTNW